MDREWAKSQNWPESMYLPDDKSKGVYLLEAYHQLHCLRILRKTMGESLTGQAFTWTPGKHIEHCFDYLLQVR
jgi:Mycotoxin biosynthesis protein UstYa